MKNLILPIVLLFAGCNTLKETTTEVIPCDQKVIGVAWDATYVRVKLRPMEIDDNPETYLITRTSSSSFRDHTVTIAECRK